MSAKRPRPYKRLELAVIEARISGRRGAYFDIAKLAPSEWHRILATAKLAFSRPLPRRYRPSSSENK